MAISTLGTREAMKNIGKTIVNAASDLLSNSDFVSRTIGMNNSYEDIMYIVQLLGREPISLLGKDFVFIYDHVRRIYQQGTTVASTMYGGDNYWCPKFTFYKGRPTIKFADVDNDPLNLLDRWMPDINLNTTKSENTNFAYAESNDDGVNNKRINNVSANAGTATGQIVGSFQNLSSCDLIRKTNENFANGKFKTLIARFHTNSMDSRDSNDPTQTAISNKYGMSHGRNLLKITPDSPNGYDNPYCRVWTYHHQYHTMNDAIRPFGDAHSAEELESIEQCDNNTVGFRTTPNKQYNVKGGSSRLDLHGVLNYDNGFVNIAPTAKLTNYFSEELDEKDKKAISTKKCMFSIENLAWRDARARKDEYQPTGTSPEQRGPLGGRIMWFPPYDLDFSENVSVKWNSNEFIGRGENIYTYTNTERRGNLSFTMVIDHPSILDYWTGHERNGMKNQGDTLLPGNTDGVDGKDNQEQTLLRFFAGCDILSATPQRYEKHETTPQEELKEEEKPNIDSTKKDPNDKGVKTLCCVVYFPNNYSGVDERETNNIDYNPIYYLLNGIGTQYFVEEEKEGDSFLARKWLTLDLRSKYKLYVGKAVQNHTECSDEHGSKNKCREKCDENGIVDTWEEVDGEYGGYEMRKGYPISVVNRPLNNDYVSRARTYSCLGGKIRAQFITTEDGLSRLAVKRTTIHNDVYRTLCKIISDDIEPLKAWNKSTFLNRRWYYLIDNAYVNDDFTHPESYIDTESYGLNGSDYDWREKTAKNGNKYLSEDVWLKYIEDDDDTFHLVSFSDFAYILENHPGAITDTIDGDNIQLVRKIKEGKGVKIKDVIICGNASTAGYDKENNILAKNRAETVSWWLNKCGFPKPESGSYTITSDTESNKDNVNIGMASDFLPKVWRSATIVIKYEDSVDEHAVTTDADVNTDTISNKSDDSSQSAYSKFFDFMKTPEGEQWKNKKGNISTTELMNEYIREFGTGKKGEEETSTEIDKKNENKEVVGRYDNEGEFFELLSREKPFLHHLITEKIKYFDPAFHAISPEGFNARLTFLHQCTRQGATIGNSDYSSITAHNLAFGRPPVCVLRLGDFYYTKIIINSLTINYDSPQWDLNPEGIGVMPMFAKINIDFNFIGGSDLAGPIARLQNAVSFNYYANASVYDDRAEVVEYDPAGSGKEVKYKPFTYMDGTKYKKRGTVSVDSIELTDFNGQGPRTGNIIRS